MITPEEIVGEEWASWYRLSPQERWHQSEKLWQIYFYLGGSLETQPDTQSPFFDPRASSPRHYWMPLKKELETLRHARMQAKA